MEIEGLIKVVAQKDLNGLKVRLPNDMCRKLGIKERDVLSFAYDKEKATLQATGETSAKMRSFPAAYFAKSKNGNATRITIQPPNTSIQNSSSKPATPPGVKIPSYNEVPEHIIERVLLAKKKGMKLDQLKQTFKETTEYEWEEIPEASRKELETE